MAWRAVLLVALLGVASAGDVGSTTKCSWNQGVCSASPGYLMGAIAPVKAPTPLAQGILRSLAFDAACQVHKTSEACEAHAVDGCNWVLNNLNDGEPVQPSCTVLPDWAEAKGAKLGSMHGCPGSVGHALHACAAAESRDACAAVDAECAWLDEAEAHAALTAAGATSEKFPQAVGPRRRLMGTGEPEETGDAAYPADVEVSAAGMDAAEEAVGVTKKIGRDTLIAPDGEALVGCVPAKMRQLVDQRDIAALNKLNANLEDGTDGTYGHCDAPAVALLEKCSALAKQDECVATKECQWDGEYHECAVKQGFMMEKLLGTDSPGVARAMECHARLTEAECVGAGEVKYDVEELGKGLVDGPELPVVAVMAADADETPMAA